MSGRNKRGQFTPRYNKRLDVRKTRFESVSTKRKTKNFRSTSIMSASTKIISRKILAGMVLPVLTHNGTLRTVNAPIGNTLGTLCEFNYKQGTLNKFFSELKYLGASSELLKSQVLFWQKIWASCEIKHDSPLLCYYVDGNTKAYWSGKSVKKNKVTMLGKVMGCLEQVFVHDNHGHPIYFETYSGNAPIGEYVLEMFGKIEDNLLEMSDATFHVNRAIVLDGASNSVKTLRAFSSQKKYHYITTLDDNQFKERKIRKQGRPQRYHYGKATLRECEIELIDSKEKNYIVAVRAIKIEWDHGKTTVLLTSLDKEIIGPSLVAKSYFDRWPYQELQFRNMKSGACIHRIAGYGKQVVDDPKVRKRKKELQISIKKLRLELSEILSHVAYEENKISSLVKQERVLRDKSKIANGIRKMSIKDKLAFEAIGKKILRIEAKIKERTKPNLKQYKKLQKLEGEWMRLQTKGKTYQADVELDQTMTTLRVGFVNLCSYFTREILKLESISLNNLIQNIFMLPGYIKESKVDKIITIDRNMKSNQLMGQLESAMKIINKLEIKNINGKIIRFYMKN